MKRTLIAALFALAASFAIAQPTQGARAFDARVKQEVLGELKEVITTVAFVPGADFAKWPDVLEEYKEEIDASKSPDEFAFVVNTALQTSGSATSSSSRRPLLSAARRTRWSGSGCGSRSRRTAFA
jgi:hypothetical protein